MLNQRVFIFVGILVIVIKEQRFSLLIGCFFDGIFPDIHGVEKEERVGGASVFPAFVGCDDGTHDAVRGRLVDGGDPGNRPLSSLFGFQIEHQIPNGQVGLLANPAI